MPSIRNLKSGERRGRRMNPLQTASSNDDDTSNKTALQILQNCKPVINMSLINIAGNRYEGDVTVAGEYGYPGFDALFRQVSHTATFDSAERYAAGQCHPGTRQTIITAILDWISDPVPEFDILWLNGSAGVGKSSIAQTIASVVNDQEDKILAGSFFFSRGVRGRDDASLLFPSLAYQIGISMRGMRKHIDDAMKIDPSIPTKSIDKHFPHLIVDPLLKSTFDFSKWHRPTVVIDGLDECQDPKMQLKILSLIVQAGSQHIPLRFLITSRPEDWIRRAFDSETLQKRTNMMTMYADEETDEDIRRYLLHRFDEIYTEKQALMDMIKVSRPWPSRETVEEIVESASGQFIYASTLCNFLEPRFCNPVQELKTIMKANSTRASAFSDLDNLYRHILSQFPYRNDLHDILAGILLDFPLRAIQVFFRIGYDKIFLAVGALRSVLLVPDGLDGYVADDERLESTFGPPDSLGAAKLCHASFREFLLDSSRSGDFKIDLVKTRRRLVRTYFGILGSALQEEYPHNQNSDMPFPLYIGVLSGAFESCLGNPMDWYPRATLMLSLKQFQGQLTAFRARSLSNIREPGKLLHYVQNAIQFLKDRQSNSHLGAEAMTLINLLISDLKNCMFHIVVCILPLHYPDLSSSRSPLYLNVEQPDILVTLDDLAKMFNMSSDRMADELIYFRDFISSHHVVGFARHYCLSILAVTSRAFYEKRVLDDDNNGKEGGNFRDDARLRIIHSVSRVLAGLPNMMDDGHYSNSPFRSSRIAYDILSSFFEEPLHSDVQENDLSNKDFISVLNLTLDLPNGNRSQSLHFQISPNILQWRERQCGSAEVMERLEMFDPGLCMKLINLPMRVYHGMILPTLANPYTSDLCMLSTKKHKMISLKVMPTNGSEYLIIEKDASVPLGTIIPRSFELCEDDYETIIGSLPEEMHTEIRTRFVEFVLNMWAKHVYCQLHQGFEDCSDIVRYGLSLPCFRDGQDGLVYPTEGILIALRAIKCLAPAGKTTLPFGIPEQLIFLMRLYPKSEVSEDELDAFDSWLEKMKDCNKD